MIQAKNLSTTRFDPCARPIKGYNYQRSEKAFVNTLAEMYIQGVSTRKVKAVTEELCGHAFSASTVSAMNVRLQGQTLDHNPDTVPQNG